MKDKSKVNFSYRDNLWHGSDLLATGVASFGHVSGVHYQNLPDWPAIRRRARSGASCRWAAACAPRRTSLLVREMILQLKTGQLDAGYFRRKFGVDILDHWRDAWQQYQADGYLEISGDTIRLTRSGLLHADGLLLAFFEPEHRGVRYT